MRPSKFQLANKIVTDYLKKNYNRDYLYFGWTKKGLKIKKAESGGFWSLIPISQAGDLRFIPPFGLKDIDVLERIQKLAKEKSWRELRKYQLSKQYSSDYLRKEKSNPTKKL